MGGKDNRTLIGIKVPFFWLEHELNQLFSYFKKPDFLVVH